MMNISTDVCIVGAGPAGSFLAYLLAKQGISVVLLERQAKIHKLFRGELLNGDGEALLKQQGLYQEIVKMGLLPHQAVEYWSSGSVVQHIAPAGKETHLGIHVPQDHLLTVLLQKASAYPNFQLFTGAAFKNYILDSANRIVGVTAQINGEMASIQSRLIVGADGRASTIRKKSGIEPRIKQHPFDVLWARIPEPPNWAPATRMALIEEQQLALFSQTGGYVQIGWNIARGSFPELRKGSFLPFVARLTTTFPDLIPSVEANIRSWNDFVLLSVFSSLSETWAKDNVVLIGDAAHTMTPTGAFGVNAALEDAYELSLLISNLARAGYTDCSSLNKLEEQRIEKVKLQLARQETMEMQFAAKITSFMN
ncbi:FAD-dependent oxidoreductase [Neobacillus mesonae]|nr:FAD-dependent oxidoreductase [Neobacillus mesonae]